MKKSLAILAVALGIAVIAAYAFVDVSGTWEMTSEGRQGPRTTEITIEQDGNNIKVTMPGFRGGDPIVAEGTVDGNNIEWSVTRETPRGEFTMTYKGTVDGDTMSGTMNVMDRESEWTAKKK
jgi:hypothetical protein